MSKKILLLGAIASIIAINSAFANTVVTSQTYVDNADALKQDKITAGTTGSVVTYNGTQNGQAQFSERGIFNFETDLVNGEIVSGHEGDLLDAGSILPALVGMDDALQGTAGNVIIYDENGYAGGERGIYDGSNEYDSSTDADKLVTASVVQNASNNLPTKTVTYKTCTRWVDGQSHTDANCLLWSLNDIPIRAKQCYTDADCTNAQGLGCSSPTCDAGVCFCGSR